MKDPISHLAAVTLALHDAQNASVKSEFEIACCEFFLADAVREAECRAQYLAKTNKD